MSVIGDNYYLSADKLETARKCVDKYAKIAFTTGFTPVPFSDAPLITKTNS